MIKILWCCLVQAAASMNVSIGYFCDPEGLEGLAHFLGKWFRLVYNSFISV